MAVADGTVLIVDDDQSLAETLSKAMSSRGFLATWRTSAYDALALLDQVHFDAVVTDLHMEEMDGFVFCERILANRPKVAVVMITAFGSKDVAAAALRAGADEFITKPFDVEALRVALVRAMEHHALRDDASSRQSDKA